MARILHILTSPRAEGTPRLALDWLSVGSHEQGVVFLTGQPADLLGDFQASGCWLQVGDAIVSGPGKFSRIILLAHQSVTAFQPDLVIAWPTGFSHWIFLGARWGSRHAALVSHGGNPPGTDWFNRYLMTWLCLWTTSLCHGRMVACSRYVQSLFREIPLIPRSIVGFAYNSVRADLIASRADAARARRAAGEPFRVLMVATLERHKDHATLIGAARLLQERGISLEILLVGAGQLEGELKALSTQLGVNGIVKFLGTRRDVPELLGQSDVFVLSTTAREGRPGVILEALAAGVPVIATAVEPVREVLENGRWGTLVRAGDRVALANLLIEAISSGGSTVDYRTNRRAFAAGFTPERMIKDYLREGHVSSPAAAGASESISPI